MLPTYSTIIYFSSADFEKKYFSYTIYRNEDVGRERVTSQSISILIIYRRSIASIYPHM